MGFIKDAKANQLISEAVRARTEGRTVFTPRLNAPAASAGHNFSGSIAGWAEMIEGIEGAGWAMYHWSVSVDEKGRAEAFPLFRPRREPTG